MNTSTISAQLTTPHLTTIYANGSKWASQGPDSIEALKDNLATYALDPDFIHSETITPYQVEHLGKIQFFGNFTEFSAVFHLATIDTVLIAELATLIEANPTVTAWRAKMYTAHLLG